MRLVMAFVVVAIHTRPDLSFSSPVVKELSEIVYSIPVPFFFIASGFLLFRKISLPLTSKGILRIKCYLKRVCRLYLTWTIIYLPLTIYGFYKDGLSFGKSVIVFFRNILFIGENYMSWPLWYLLALIVSVGIILILLQLKCSLNKILVISVITAFIGVLLDYFHANAEIKLVELYFEIFQKTRNGFFVGFMYVAIGMRLSKIKRMPLLLIVGFLSIGIVGVITNITLLYSLIVTVLFVAAVSIRIRNLSKTSTCRHMSIIVYYIHMLITGLLVEIFHVPYGAFLFLWIVVLSLIISTFLLKHGGHEYINSLVSGNILQ